jgi:hypothetical protein
MPCLGGGRRAGGTAGERLFIAQPADRSRAGNLRPQMRLGALEQISRRIVGRRLRCRAEWLPRPDGGSGRTHPARAAGLGGC